MDVSKYKVKEVPIKDFTRYTKKLSKEIIIVKENEETGSWIPSRLTDYLKVYCGNQSNNSKKKEASYITSFLNYVSEQVELGKNKEFDTLKEKGLYGINLYHLVFFLNTFEKSNSFETFKNKEHVLLKFYNYLYKLGITGEDAKIEEIPVPVKRGDGRKKQVIWQMVNPFTRNPNYKIFYPKKSQVVSGVLKDMDEDVWHSFVDYARKFYPNIALGVMFQICGGLRQGEVVNLTLDSIDIYEEKNYMYVDIEDRQIDLFGKTLETKHSQVKKVRSQPVFNFNGELFNILKEHLDNLDKNPSRKNFSALFLNSYGEPMTGDVYQKQFKKLKRDFLKLIKERKPELYEDLSTLTWGSHIGRHIFTNHLIKKGYLKNIVGYDDARLLMILRGDTSTKSAETYINTKSITENVASQIDIVSAIAVSTIL